MLTRHYLAMLAREERPTAEKQPVKDLEVEVEREREKPEDERNG